MEHIFKIEEERMMKREMISKLQDLLDEYEDNAWNRREHQIISLRRKIEGFDVDKEDGTINQQLTVSGCKLLVAYH